MAAYVAIVVLLVTIGILLSFSNIAPLSIAVRLTASTVIIILTGGGVFAAWKMVQLGKIILSGLGHEKERVPRLFFIKYPRNQLIAIVVALLLGLWDTCLVIFSH